MSKLSDEVKALSKQALHPQEKPAALAEKQGNLLVGVPKERANHENRVALTPEAVEAIAAADIRVMVESKAGNEASFTDDHYRQAGAQVVDSAEEVFACPVVLKVEPPTPKELDLMKPQSTLVSAMLPCPDREAYLKQLKKKKITALGYELIEDKIGGMPIVRAMSEVAGSAVMLIAAELLATSSGGKGMLLGGVTGVSPTQVAILGSGTVAEYAARAALGLGADVKVFDHQLYKLRRLKHALGRPLYTSTLDSSTLKSVLPTTDVLIGAYRLEKEERKVVVTEEMVEQMPDGSVIIDVSIDQGGIIETSELRTHVDPVFTKYGVVHFCVPNIASRYPRTASRSLANIFTPIVLRAAEEGGLEELIFNHPWLMRGVYTYRGSITNKPLANKYGMNYTDLGFLNAGRN